MRTSGPESGGRGVRLIRFGSATPNRLQCCQMKKYPTRETRISLGVNHRYEREPKIFFGPSFRL